VRGCLLGEVPDLVEVDEITDETLCSAFEEAFDRGNPGLAADVDDNFVAVVEEGGGCGAAEAFGRSGDQDAGDGVSFEAGLRRSVQARRESMGPLST
jgi:hypothetical protein